MLNIIVPKCFGEKKRKEKDPKGAPKTLMPLIGVYKFDGGQNPWRQPQKKTKQQTCGVELQGLPNLTKKKNDEKLEKKMK